MPSRYFSWRKFLPSQSRPQSRRKWKHNIPAKFNTLKQAFGPIKKSKIKIPKTLKRNRQNRNTVTADRSVYKQLTELQRQREITIMLCVCVCVCGSSYNTGYIFNVPNKPISRCQHLDCIDKETEAAFNDFLRYSWLRDCLGCALSGTSLQSPFVIYDPFYPQFSYIWIFQGIFSCSI